MILHAYMHIRNVYLYTDDAEALDSLLRWLLDMLHPVGDA